MPPPDARRTGPAATGTGNRLKNKERRRNSQPPRRLQSESAIRAILAGRRAEDRRRDLLWLEKHLDEEILDDVQFLARDLDEVDSDLTRTTLVQRLRQIEEAAETAITVLARVLDDEAAP